MMDASCGGSVMTKDENEVWTLFENLSDASQLQSTFDRRDKPVAARTKTKKDVNELSVTETLTSTIAVLSDKVELFLKRDAATTPVSAPPHLKHPALSWRQPPPPQPQPANAPQTSTSSFMPPTPTPFEAMMLKSMAEQTKMLAILTETQQQVGVDTQAEQLLSTLNRREDGRPAQPPQNRQVGGYREPKCSLINFSVASANLVFTNSASRLVSTTSDYVTAASEVLFGVSGRPLSNVGEAPNDLADD
ncbi:hypothetical protein Dimus_015445 [Dionaea muscipula]